MVDLTFPQPGDLPDAAYFAFATGRARSGIVSGLTFTPDFTVPEVTVDAGKAVIDRGEMTTAHPDIDPPETVSDAVAVVEIEPQTVALDSATLNHIFLEANVSNDDSGAVVANTTGSKPTNASLKIGEIDTSANSVSEQFNKIEDDGTLSFPDADAANAALSSLPDGVGVIDRTNGVLIYDDALSAATLEAGTITDGANVSHSDELADATDVSPIQSSSDVTVTDTQTGTVNDQEFLKNEGGILTGGTVQTEPNVPDWKEESNSPHSVASSSQTFQVTDVFDEYKIKINVTATSSSADIALSDINSASANFAFRTPSGQTAGASSILLGHISNNGRTLKGEFKIQGRWDDIGHTLNVWDIPVGVIHGGGTTPFQVTEVGLEPAVADPNQDTQLSSFTLDLFDLSGTVEVYGRDI